MWGEVVARWLGIGRLGFFAGPSAKCQPGMPTLAIPIPFLGLIEQALLDALFRAPSWLVGVE